MKITRTALFIILALTLSLSLSACADGDSVTEFSPELIVTPTPPTESSPEPTPVPTPEPEETVHEHVWQDANYQQPRMCIECYETEGVQLTPKFVEYGFSLAEHGVSVPYITRASGNDSRVVGHVSVTNFSIVDGIEVFDDGSLSIMSFEEGADWRLNENLISSFQDRGMIIDADFEWRVIDIDVVFSCNVSNSHGFQLRSLNDFDYYSFDILEPFTPPATRTVDGGISWDSFTFYYNYNGIDYESQGYSMMFSTGWMNNVNTLTYKYHYFVPVGFDGMLVAFFNAVNIGDNSSGTLIKSDLFDVDTVFFRVG